MITALSLVIICPHVKLLQYYHIPYAVYYILVAYVFCNWRIVPLNPFTSFTSSLFLFYVCFAFRFYSIIFCLCWVFIAACGLSLVVANWGYSLAAVCRLLILVASLVAEHRLQGAWVSRAAA